MNRGDYRPLALPRFSKPWVGGGDDHLHLVSQADSLPFGA